MVKLACLRHYFCRIVLLYIHSNEKSDAEQRSSEKGKIISQG